MKLRFVEVPATDYGPQRAGDALPISLDLDPGERVVSVEGVRRADGGFDELRMIARIWIAGSKQATPESVA